MADVELVKNLDAKIAHLAGVKAAVRDEGEMIAARAEAILSIHHKTGEHRIEVEHGITDTEVSLVGDHAVSLEYGHENARTGTFTEGLYIMTTAAHL